MTEHNHTDALSSMDQSFLEQKNEQLRYLRENPPKFKKKTWTYGSKKLSVCCHIDTAYVEITNMLINYDLPLDSSPEFFVYLEIYDTKTRKAVHVRVKGSDVQYTHQHVDMKRKFQEQLNWDLNPIDTLVLNYIHVLGNPEEFLSEYHFTGQDANGNLIYTAQRIDGHSSCIVSPALLFQPRPKSIDLDKTFTCTYDLKEIEEGKTAPGAFLSISYKHMDKNGTPNVKPWKIKISNYTLTHSIPHPSKTNVAEQFVTLSDDEYRTLCDYINDENNRWFEYMIEWNYWIAENQ